MIHLQNKADLRASLTLFDLARKRRSGKTSNAAVQLPQRLPGLTDRQNHRGEIEAAFVSDPFTAAGLDSQCRGVGQGAAVAGQGGEGAHAFGLA
ncbi:hypothetical protein ABVN22_20845 [Pseudomonas poae]|uniref:hypothetical protein n=1 Tax=Pseudomonas poae TaxID=200451 RepID=UPI0015E48C0C